MNNILQDKTPVYRGAAKLPGTPRAAFFCILALIAVCVILFNLVAPIPYSVFLKIAIIVFAAVSINYILKQGTFSVTYVLTDDGILVYITKYGLLEWESAWIDATEAEFKGNKIIYKKKKYDFYPDEELKGLLGI
ncbi:MAG: hypothetical protein ACI4SS_04675 [Clostridia bacterium]